MSTICSYGALNSIAPCGADGFQEREATRSLRNRSGSSLKLGGGSLSSVLIRFHLTETWWNFLVLLLRADDHLPPLRLQEEYKAEGLNVQSIPFRDNQPIIDLIAKRPAGLMPILEDQASV